MNKYHGHTSNAQDTKPNWAPKPYSQNQANLITKLVAEKGISKETFLAQFPARPETFEDGSKIISWLYEQSKANPSQPSSPQVNNWDDITDGNYALPYKGKTHFYRVSRKEGKGKWVGRTFVNVQERASDELYRIEDRKRQTAILHSIREYGVEESHLLFSQVMDKCWHCLKSIGDETNPYKVHGLGPVCGPNIMG